MAMEELNEAVGKRKRKASSVAKVVALTAVFLSIPANATTYFIDHSDGNDGNTGLDKAHAWQRHPYMAGFTGTYSHTAGDVFTFRGGVTWPADCFGYMLVKLGGSSTANVDLYTVDKTWFTGASWARPIFDAQSQRQSMILIGTLSPWSATANYVTFDNIEMANLYWSGNLAYGVVSFVNQVTGTHDIIFQNCYIHDWSHATYAAGARDCMSVFVGAGANSPYNAGCIVTNCVIDGGAANATNGTSSGVGFLQWGGQVRNCTIKNCVSAVLVGQGNTNSIVAGNNIGPTLTSFDSAIHDNGLEVNYGGSPHYFYNNYTHDTHGVCWMIGGNGGEVDYVFNNVFYNNAVYPIQVDTTANGSQEYIWNNSFNFGGYSVRGNRTGTLGVVSLINNHAMTDSGIWTAGTASVTSFTNANNVTESTTQATTDGYVLSNLYQPTASNSPTVGAGQSLASQLSGLLTNDILGVARPQGTNWDAGAYEFVSGGGGGGGGSVPNTPSNVTPADAATGQSLTPTLTGSAYSSSGGSQTGAEFKVWSQDELTLINDSRVLGAVNFYAVPSSTLAYGTTYKWNCAYQDATGWSSYSPLTSFTTQSAPVGTNAVLIKMTNVTLRIQNMRAN